MNELADFKKELNAISQDKRNVTLWNNMRESFKSRYPHYKKTNSAISQLDASGFIYTWLGNIKKERFVYQRKHK